VRPLDGSKGKAPSNFSEQQIFEFHLSGDQKTTGVLHMDQQTDIVLVPRKTRLLQRLTAAHTSNRKKYCKPSCCPTWPSRSLRFLKICNTCRQSRRIVGLNLGSELKAQDFNRHAIIPADRSVTTQIITHVTYTAGGGRIATTEI
jgi:hypothetical protein